MANIEARLLALESRANTADQSLKVFICKGSEPTAEEREKINSMGDKKTIVVVFGKPDPDRFKG